MYEVIYFSRAGSTKKVATAIADELDVEARDIASVKSLPEGAYLFLGSGLYFMRPSRLIREFIRDNAFEGRDVALFGTSASGKGIEIKGMESLLKQKGAVITGRYYCKGKFYSLRRGRPSRKDLELAGQFARSVSDRLQGTKQIAGRREEKHEDRVLSRV